MFPDLPSRRPLTATELSQLAELERSLSEDTELARTFGRRGPRIPRMAAVEFLGVSVALVIASAFVGGFGGAAAVVVTLILTVVVLAVAAKVRLRAARPTATRTD